MIQIENLKAVLSEIGFIKEAIGDYFQIDYGTCIVAVDFDKRIMGSVLLITYQGK